MCSRRFALLPCLFFVQVFGYKQHIKNVEADWMDIKETMHDIERQTSGEFVRRISRAVDDDAQPEEKPSIHQRYSTERSILRLLQVLLFLLSFVFARTVLDVEGWTHHGLVTLLVTCLFALLFVSLSHFLPQLVPLFLAVMALPPFVDDDNLSFFFPQILDDHMQDEEVVECMARTGTNGTTPRFEERKKTAMFVRSRSTSKGDLLPPHLQEELHQVNVSMTLNELKNRVASLEAKTNDSSSTTANGAPAEDLAEIRYLVRRLEARVGFVEKTVFRSSIDSVPEKPESPQLSELGLSQSDGHILL
eukprot:TRINITY_DN13553_c0_g1_i3.p1 TRINITY_DN13553_c0_g1~~TRINITY_DN13553_c0_g1_i3.p1  ORF type:complete len:323 (-),score=52.42 TRINITY_DN13553_c0_g1_i3:64-978(-)